jgi:hypothetical protein
MIRWSSFGFLHPTVVKCSDVFSERSEYVTTTRYRNPNFDNNFWVFVVLEEDMLLFISLAWLPVLDIR